MTDRVAAVHDLAADITKAIIADPQRNGLAVDTSIIGIDYDASQETAPLAACRVEVVVLYRHSLGDPYTTA